jgi:CDP-diacylglycerol---glycerol-3-phosphate 3-phosphatidyltransferase
LFDGYARTVTDKAVKPIGRGLARLGITPDHLTAIGLLMSVATAIVIGAGYPRWGFLLLLASALPDLFDGAVAKASKSSSIRGAFFDSVADRVTDAFLLGGIGWYLQERHGGRIAMLAYAVLGASTLISYQRAKAEIYGFSAKGGLMERAERIIALAIGLMFPSLLIPILWIMLVLVSITAVQRFVKVWRQAEKPPIPTKPEKVMWSEVAAARRALRQEQTARRRRGRNTTQANKNLTSPWKTWNEERGRRVGASIEAWRERVKQRSGK